jgi:hypothetical protein
MRRHVRHQLITAGLQDSATPALRWSALAPQKSWSFNSEKSSIRGSTNDSKHVRKPVRAPIGLGSLRAGDPPRGANRRGWTRLWACPDVPTAARRERRQRRGRGAGCRERLWTHSDDVEDAAAQGKLQDVGLQRRWLVAVLGRHGWHSQGRRHGNGSCYGQVRRAAGSVSLTAMASKMQHIC